eukprot:CAMPEP_0119325834 /NCGR_PEP_ID=MMETSP1333-20130426/66800_1 /TAXON_ID=418940 /ORGANISM="Scyphosphaera apsteinii, Strain RCC1455" /LENGTH=74 /DNA_ID=CAMNT_0007333953 /DNA_START=705 /DNA_END=929 /DNA_ORIENTATION=+
MEMIGDDVSCTIGEDERLVGVDHASMARCCLSDEHWYGLPSPGAQHSQCDDVIAVDDSPTEQAVTSQYVFMGVR